MKLNAAMSSDEHKAEAGAGERRKRSRRCKREQERKSGRAAVRVLIKHCLVRVRVRLRVRMNGWISSSSKSRVAKYKNVGEKRRYAALHICMYIKCVYVYYIMLLLFVRDAF